MRRAQWSFLDLLPWDSSTTSGSWTIAATTLAARTGSGPNGMRASWDGVTKGTAYQTLPFQSNTARFSHWRGGCPSLLEPTGNILTCDIRGYIRTTLPTDTAQVHLICDLRDNVPNQAFTLSLQRSGANRKLSLSGTLSTFSLAASTYYRLEIRLEINTSGVGTATLSIYEENTNVLLDRFSVAISIGTNGFYEFRLGNVQTTFPFAGGTAFTIDFADWAINNASIPDSLYKLHTGPLGPGSTFTVDRPASDNTKGWGSTAGIQVPPDAAVNHSTEIDEATPNNADFVNTLTTSGKIEDLYNLPDYSGPAANQVKSIAIHVKHTQHSGIGNNDFLHEAGLHDGTNRQTGELGSGGIGVYVYQVIIVDEIYGGGQWTNALYNAVLASVYKNTTAAYDKDIVYLAVEAEDDDGIPWPPPKITAQNVNQSVKRASIW